ncbi:MAG: hypothetical protein ACKOAO_04360 [Oxalobacteraceae bacterium]|jgi:O-antigen/teichoic acid export membrane protein
MVTRREKIFYFSLALALFMVFRHLLGPLLGLSGLALTVSSYVFAILLATVYLYKTLLRPTRSTENKGDA